MRGGRFFGPYPIPPLKVRCPGVSYGGFRGLIGGSGPRAGGFAPEGGLVWIPLAFMPVDDVETAVSQVGLFRTDRYVAGGLVVSLGTQVWSSACDPWR